jgi:glycosyltransferase involved in cell wall biosynthesis
MTKISIITVVYNGEKTIENTIQSIISQKNIDLEYIIIDGKSTDGTLDIVSKYKDYIDTVVSEKDGGIYHAMNKGLLIASGSIIGFLNADDIYNSPYILEKIISTFDSDPSADLVYGDLVYVGQYDPNKIIRYWKSKKYYSNFFNDGNIPPHPTFFARKTAYDNFSGFNLNFRLAADFEIMFRFLKIHQLTSVYIPYILVRMRLGGTTNNSFKNIFDGNREIINTFKLHGSPMSALFWVKRIIRKLVQFITISLDVQKF